MESPILLSFEMLYVLQLGLIDIRDFVRFVV